MNEQKIFMNYAINDAIQHAIKKLQMESGTQWHDVEMEEITSTHSF